MFDFLPIAWKVTTNQYSDKACPVCRNDIDLNSKVIYHTKGGDAHPFHENCFHELPETWKKTCMLCLKAISNVEPQNNKELIKQYLLSNYRKYSLQAKLISIGIASVSIIGYVSSKVINMFHEKNIEKPINDGYYYFPRQTILIYCAFEAIGCIFVLFKTFKLYQIIGERERIYKRIIVKFDKERNTLIYRVKNIYRHIFASACFLGYHICLINMLLQKHIEHMKDTEALSLGLIGIISAVFYGRETSKLYQEVNDIYRKFNQDIVKLESERNSFKWKVENVVRNILSAFIYWAILPINFVFKTKKVITFHAKHYFKGNT